MMPGNVLSTTLMYASYLPPDNITPSLITSYQLGGIGLSDASQGLQVQTWTLTIAGPLTLNDMVISSPNTPATVLLSKPNVTSISLAFDQNMKPCIAYVSQGNAYFWWYDTTIPGYTIIALPAGTTTPQCTFDDKRKVSINIGKSDIILCYLLNNDLYMRQERDRFTIDYVLRVSVGNDIPNPSLLKIGMNNIGRLEFTITGSLWQ